MFSISTTSTFINTFDPMMGSMILILGDVPIPLFLRLESSTKPCPITVLARNHIHAVPNHVAFTLSRKFAKKNPIPSEDLSTPPVRTSTSALHFFLSVLVSLSVQVLCPAALERCAGIRPLLKLQCACRESNLGHKHGRLVCCRYTTGALVHAMVLDLFV